MKKGITSWSKIVPIAVAGILLAGVLAFTAGGTGSARNNWHSHDKSNHEYFLSIEGIEGGSNNNDQEGLIELLSYDWGNDEPGVQQTTTNGGGAGGATANDFHFSAKASQASPSLMQATASGQHIPEATLTVSKKSENNDHAYFTITMTNVVVSSYQSSGESGKKPKDNVSLNFETLEIQYQQNKEDDPVTGGWDFLNNIGL